MSFIFATQPLLASIHLNSFFFRLPPSLGGQILALHGELRYYEELAGKKSVFDGDELQTALGDAWAVGGGYVLEQGPERVRAGWIGVEWPPCCNLFRLPHNEYGFCSYHMSTLFPI